MKAATTACGSAAHRGGVRIAIAALVLAAVLAVVATAAGCGSTAGHPSAAATTIKMGGELKVGAQAGNGSFDPVLFNGAVGDIQLQSQIYEKLVTLGQD